MLHVHSRGGLSERTGRHLFGALFIYFYLQYFLFVFGKVSHLTPVVWDIQHCATRSGRAPGRLMQCKGPIAVLVLVVYSFLLLLLL